MARNKGGTESLKRKIAALQKAKSDIPTLIGNKAVTFFRMSFRKQGWEDEGLQRWKPRKGEIGRGIAQVRRRDPSSRAILVKTGDLRRSIQIESADWRRVRISSNLPYSAIHNEGLRGRAWGKTAFKMPKRKFMGRSRKLHNQIKDMLEKRLNTVFKA